jgi:hypothetical protein
MAATSPSRHAHKEAKESVKNDDIYQEEQQDEQEKLKLVKKAIDCITDCCFDNGCVLMFKKCMCIKEKTYV